MSASADQLKRALAVTLSRVDDYVVIRSWAPGKLRRSAGDEPTVAAAAVAGHE